MKPLSELIQTYKNTQQGKRCSQWKQTIINEIIEKYGLDMRVKAIDDDDRFRKTYGKWLGIISRSKKEWAECMEILKVADSLPDKYNKLGYIVNKLKPIKTLKLL